MSTSTQPTSNRPFRRQSIIRLIESRESLAARGIVLPDLVATVDQVTRSRILQVGGIREYIVDMLGVDGRRRNVADLRPERCRVVFLDGRRRMGNNDDGYTTILDWLLSLDELPLRVEIAQPDGGTLVRYLR